MMNRKTRPAISPRRWAPVLLAAAIAQPAIASSQEGTVVWYAADINTTPYAFVMAGPRSARPACATDDAWSIPSPTTDGPKALLAGVMTARAGNRTLAVTGAGVCDPAQPTREMVQYILFF
jgi:hypothetical protein